MIKISYATGTTETHNDLDAALVALRSVFGDGIVVDGLDNLPNGSALVWRDEEAAENDDGARAVARIKELVAE